MTNTNKTNEVQRRILSIYKEIKMIADQNNLRFFAIAGTAIGAVRHKGFIPWDDDIDIAMPRKDYEKFKNLVNKLPPHMHFTDLAKDSGSPYTFGKVSDTSTSYIPGEALENTASYSGVFVDIMPFDGLPSRKLTTLVHFLALQTLFHLIASIVQSKNHNSKSTLRRRVKQAVGTLLSKLTDVNKVKGLYISTASKYKFDTSKYLGRTWLMGSHHGMKDMAKYHSEDFANYAEVPFEDTEIRIPIGYDRYLSSLYKNYMKLPPEGQRVPSHGNGITDLGHSYRYYVAKKEGKKIGYTAGCYDMFHIGHLNLIKRAKQNCDYLIVGVNADEAMFSYKGKYPVIPESERMEIIAALKYADEVVLVEDTDKMHAYKMHEYDVIFVGDDHKGEPKWVELEKKLQEKGSSVHYFEYTGHTSSTKLRSALDDIIEEKNLVKKK